MKRITQILGFALLAAPTALLAQQPAAKPAAPMTKQAPKPMEKMEKTPQAEEHEAALMKEAKVSEAVARAAALKEVPGGVVKAHELEREKGKLIWSYDIAVAGKSGIEEVAIDAISGKMVAHEHETAKDEQKEAAEDAAKLKAKAATVKKP